MSGLDSQPLRYSQVAEWRKQAAVNRPGRPPSQVRILPCEPFTNIPRYDTEYTMGPREALKKWRKDNDLSQAQLAKRLGIYQGDVSNIERGKSSPSLPVAVLLKEETGIPIEDWVGQ